MKGEGDEFFVLSGKGSLDFVMVTDNEGSIRFPAGSYSGGLLVVAREGKAYRSVHGSPPDFEMYDTDKGIPDAIRTKNLQMGNSGDELILYVNGKKVQEISWPKEIKKGEGRVHVLKDGVWDERPHFIGQSDFSSETFYGATVTAFISPDCSLEVLEKAVSDSKSKIRLNVYELTGTGIAEMLAEKAESGVRLEVLLEGSPVGGISEEENYAASKLLDAGASVYSVSTRNGVFHTPYRYNHAKYMIVDEKSLLISSENLGSTGYPKSGYSGNRGYGVYIEDSGTALYFSEVFSSDISGGWVTPLSLKHGSPEDISDEPFSPAFKPRVFSGVSVTPVISPDTSYLIGDMIADAKHSVCIEQAYIKNWSSGQNPYLMAAISAAGRGVDVRIILDSYWFNIEGESDNDEMAACINSAAASENLPLEAALINLDTLGCEKIHNKAVIVDEEYVLVSSVNWNENSPLYNREAGVILSGGGIGQYYQKAFDYDWERREGALPSGIAQALTGDDGYGLKCLAGIFVIAVFAGIYAKRKR